MFNVKMLEVVPPGTPRQFTADPGDVVVVCRSNGTTKASASGKTQVVASTNGNASLFIEGTEHKLGLNLFRP